MFSFFTRFFNWLRGKPFEERFREDSIKSHSYAHDVISGYEDVLPTPFQEPVPVFTTSITPDGHPYFFHRNLPVRGTFLTQPPYTIQVAVSRNKRSTNKPTIKHEFGHDLLVRRLRIYHHDERFDKYFSGWSISRRLSDRVMSALRHPRADRTEFEMKKVDGMLIEIVKNPKIGDVKDD